MKIWFVVSSMNYGGAERVVSILANRWISDGHEVAILTQNEAVSSYELDNKIDLFSIQNSKHKIHQHWQIIKNIRSICIKQPSPDCVIVFYNDLCALTALALIGTGIPIIYSERNDPGRTNQRIIDKIYRKIVEHFVNGFVFQTIGAQNQYPGFVKEKSEVIVNPLNIMNLPCWKEQKNDRYVITVGRLSEQKRQDVLIDAFQIVHIKFPEYKLRIYGQGKRRDYLETRVKEKGIEGIVQFMGTSSDIHTAIAKSSAFVLSSDYEGIPNVLVEAMAIGVPCVSTDCSPGGARLFIKSGENGIIVPCNNPEQLAKGLIKILSDSCFANKISNNALSIRKIVDSKVIADKWINFIKKATKVQDNFT